MNLEAGTDLYEGRKDTQLNRYRAQAPGAGLGGPALQAEVPDEYGTDREPEKDSRAAPGYCARPDRPARAGTWRPQDGEKIMAETTGQPERQKHHKELIGTVISNKMQKTIVVEVTLKKAHPMYKRVIAIRQKFYAHDEKNEAHSGDVVRIEESRPLSKLKRWTLKEIVRKTALVPEVDVDAGTGIAK